MPEHQITSEEQLRAITGEPVHELVIIKSADCLTPSMKKYIQLSPFVCMATHGADGSADVSPRGDAPGFVHILDDHTLVIPDRPGNKRLDSIINIIEQSSMGLLFMIPGVLETLRVNGKGIVSTDPELLRLFDVNGKLPSLVIVVTVEEALGHCSKAFRRAKLWQADYLPDSDVPTLAELMSGHLQLDDDTTNMLEFAIEDDAQNNMY
ncbi:MSMEG_1061 family FMN-dependent PPOX-type flavoprotein [Halioglobus maricola]|uniref:MSMEG_1061 family FMN-dependent PPOX-type flavoprotein n=1 Tax=Halioglobus maricola TaxID=2601894 RepID=UPI001478208A|nr:MSMEG_1061 family FMN-dependent PPOX-type flavoprotein [Halioglobus maricola]